MHRPEKEGMDSKEWGAMLRPGNAFTFKKGGLTYSIELLELVMYRRLYERKGKERRGRRKKEEDNDEKGTLERYLWRERIVSAIDNIYTKTDRDWWGCWALE